MKPRSESAGVFYIFFPNEEVFMAEIQLGVVEARFADIIWEHERAHLKVPLKKIQTCKLHYEVI